MAGEVEVFNFRVVLCVRVVAPQAEAHDLHCLGFSATALAVGAFVPPLGGLRLGLARPRLSYGQLLLGCMLGAGAKLDRALAVVVTLHGKTTKAFTVFAASPVMPGEIAIMTVAHVSPKN